MRLPAIIGAISAVAVLAQALPSHAQISQDNRFEILGTLIADSAAARIVMPLGNKGVDLSESGDFDEEKLREELSIEGRSIEVGDVVTITDISFDDDKIEVELNDGGTVSKGILDRITFGAGGRTTRDNDEFEAPATGSKIVLRFDDKAPPELNSDLLKIYLSPVLDFNKQNFMDSGIESLPEEFQDAVRAQEVIIGMDQSTVLMSKDRPNQRIRERVDGRQQEVWIYHENGRARDFITFEEGVVIKTVQY
jgi:hypothetical protein